MTSSDRRIAVHHSESDAHFFLKQVPLGSSLPQMFSLGEDGHSRCLIVLQVCRMIPVMGKCSPRKRAESPKERGRDRIKLWRASPKCRFNRKCGIPQVVHETSEPQIDDPSCTHAAQHRRPGSSVRGRPAFSAGDFGAEWTVRERPVRAFSLSESPLWMSFGRSMLEEVLLLHEYSEDRLGQSKPRRNPGLCVCCGEL